MFELGTMMAPDGLAGARWAAAETNGTLPTPGALIRQGLALLITGRQVSRNGHAPAWRTALQR
jgi:hypothetical protein